MRNFASHKKMIQEKKSTHPWPTDEVEALVEAKQAAEGTPNEREAAEACRARILRQFIEYTKESAQKLRRLLPGSKGWWTKTRRLMEIKPAVSRYPVYQH